MEILIGSEIEEVELEFVFNIFGCFICKKIFEEKLYDYKDLLSLDVFLVGNDFLIGFFDEVIE